MKTAVTDVRPTVLDSNGAKISDNVGRFTVTAVAAAGEEEIGATASTIEPKMRCMSSLVSRPVYRLIAACLLLSTLFHLSPFSQSPPLLGRLPQPRSQPLSSVRSTSQSIILRSPVCLSSTPRGDPQAPVSRSPLHGLFRLPLHKLSLRSHRRPWCTLCI